MAQYGLWLKRLYKYKIKIKIRSGQVDKINWNNGIGKPKRCKWIFWTSDVLLKASQCKLTVPIQNVIIRRWTHSNGEINGFSWNRWKHTFDGPDICFLPSLKYSLRIFVTTIKSYGGGNGNPLFLTGPFQPWQALTLLPQRLTKVIRTSLQVTSRITFMKLLKGLIFTKKSFQFYRFFCKEYFAKIREICV